MVNLLKDYEPVLKAHFDEFNLSKMMVSLIDIVAVEALPYLAKQFNVYGFRGWDLADTEQKQRELIKSGIEIARTTGTPYSIKRALAALGYDNVTITENVAVANYHNGLYLRNGTINRSGSGGASQWVNFNVTISVPDPEAISEQTQTMIRLLINEYKNARSVLVNLNIIQL